ncbi:MAG: hypothetical protein AAFQ87_00130 [Bacteroidota bacterium]
MTRLALTVVLWLGITLCYGQSNFRHLQHNNKLRTSQQSTNREKSPPNFNRKRGSSPPDLHPVRLKAQKAAQHRTRRRQRTAPETNRYSSQDLYLEIRRGQGMKNLKAENRKMWSGK